MLDALWTCVALLLSLLFLPLLINRIVWENSVSYVSGYVLDRWNISYTICAIRNESM
jgi:hypothetical protein